MHNLCRYYTRVVIIPFNNPPLGEKHTVEDLEVLASLNDLMHQASRSVGFMITLGNVLDEDGFDEIRREFHPFVSKHLSGICHPRIIFGYATLLWFTSEVCVLRDYF